MNKNDRLVKLTEETIAVLREGGWQQGSNGPSRDRSKPHCINGAAWTAMHTARGVGPATVDDFIDLFSIEVGGSIISWNDRSTRTKREVLRVLRAFLKGLKSKAPTARGAT